MRIKVNPKENSLTDDKMRRGRAVEYNRVKKVHNCDPSLRLLYLAVRGPSLGSDSFDLGRQT